MILINMKMVLVWRVLNMFACKRKMYEPTRYAGMTLILEVWAQTEKCWENWQGGKNGENGEKRKKTARAMER